MSSSLLWFPRLITTTVLDVTLGHREQLDYVSTCQPRLPHDASRAVVTYYERAAR